MAGEGAFMADVAAAASAADFLGGGGRGAVIGADSTVGRYRHGHGVGGWRVTWASDSLQLWRFPRERSRGKKIILA